MLETGQYTHSFFIVSTVIAIFIYLLFHQHSLSICLTPYYVHDIVILMAEMASELQFCFPFCLIT